jgi:hypothetical protein
LATCRGKLQKKRCKLNQEINKELRLRAGAENLFKATTNKKLKETVALELSFVNSNLQLLKEQLAELNSSVDLYQNDHDPSIPMISLGLKETKEIAFQEIFSDFILEHYSEDPAIYKEAISDFSDTRQVSFFKFFFSWSWVRIFQFFLNFLTRHPGHQPGTMLECLCSSATTICCISLNVDFSRSIETLGFISSGMIP